jgi:hypothetical protein
MKCSISPYLSGYEQKLLYFIQQLLQITQYL